MSLKSEHLQLIEDSFAILKPQMDNFTKKFYHNLFFQSPELKPLFASVDMEMMRKKLSQSLSLVVINLRQPDTLKVLLEGLGDRHISYGVLPHHYPLVGQALLTTLAEFLPSEQWEASYSFAWEAAFDAIASLMQSSSIKDQDPEPSSPLTESLTQLFRVPFSSPPPSSSSSYLLGWLLMLLVLLLSGLGIAYYYSIQPSSQPPSPQIHSWL